MNFCKIILNPCKTVENAKIFLQAEKVIPSRNQHRVFLNYDICLRCQTHSVDYKIM